MSTLMTGFIYHFANVNKKNKLKKKKQGAAHSGRPTAVIIGPATRKRCFRHSWYFVMGQAGEMRLHEAFFLFVCLFFLVSRCAFICKLHKLILFKDRKIWKKKRYIDLPAHRPSTSKKSEQKFLKVDKRDSLKQTPGVNRYVSPSSTCDLNVFNTRRKQGW